MIAAAVLGHGAPAKAEAEFDLSTITCKKFFEYDKDNLSLMLMWLEGYYADEDADRRSSTSTRWRRTAKKLGEYCGKNPDHSVITAADKMMGYGDK